MLERFSGEVYGKTRDEVQRKAQAAVDEYVGCSGHEWFVVVDVDRVGTLSGELQHYRATVDATP